MTSYSGPSFEHYFIVIGFLTLILIGLFYFKKNKHIISSKLHNKKRMKVSEVTMLGQGDRALLLNLDKREFLYISGKNSGAMLTEIKSNKNVEKSMELNKLIEKRLTDV